LSNKWVCVGKILRAHSLKGELFLFLFAGSSDWYSPDMEVGLSPYQKQSPKVYLKLESLKPHKNGFIVRFPNITNRNESEILSKQFIFISDDLLVSEKGELPFLHEFLEFVVFNYSSPIGQITGFSSNGAQELLIVTNRDKIYEIPFVPNFIIETNYQNKTLKFELPDGLLELNEKS